MQHEDRSRQPQPLSSAEVSAFESAGACKWQRDAYSTTALARESREVRGRQFFGVATPLQRARFVSVPEAVRSAMRGSG